MKPNKLIIALNLAIAATAASAAGTNPIDVFTNPVAAAAVAKDPKAMAEFVNTVTEPSFYVAAASASMEPATYVKSMNAMVDPAAYKAAMELSDPAVASKWMAASMDPNFYTAIMVKMADPGKMMRWMMAPMDMKNYQPMFNAMNPALYTNCMTESMNINNSQP